jgi:hypothetical protein
VNCNGRIIVGGGSLLGNYSNKVYMLESNGYKEIQSLNFPRSHCSAAYYLSSSKNHDDVLIVAGDFTGGNSMEYIIMNDSFHSNHWSVCCDQLPLRSCSHQLNIIQNKLILTGGDFLHNSKKISNNEVWEGQISFEPELRVKWTPLPSMLESRRDHVAAVIGDKLFCIGGYNMKSTEYYSFETNDWKKGPDLPYSLWQAKSVVNPASQECFIIGGFRTGSRKFVVGVFDPIKGFIGIPNEFEVSKHGLVHHIAVLL